MKEGDYLTCKNSFYDWNNIGDTFEIKVRNLFKEPIFKKGKRYKIDKIIEFVNSTTTTTLASIATLPVNNINKSNLTTSTTTTTTSTTTIRTNTYYSTVYIINQYNFNEERLKDVFYTQTEERSLKLKKLKKLEIEL